MKILMRTYITDNRPEEMMVVYIEGLYLVQSFSTVTQSWITLAEHLSEYDALKDCACWY